MMPSFLPRTRLHGYTAEIPQPSAGARLRAWAARRFGSGLLLPTLLREEGREVRGYLSLYQTSPDGPAGPTALRLAKESKEHAETFLVAAGVADRFGRAPLMSIPPPPS